MNSAGKSSHHHHHRHQKQPGAKTSSRNHKPRASRESNSSTGTSAATSSKTASSSRTRDRLTEENILIHRLISYYYNLHRIRKGEQPAKAMATKGGDMGDGESYDKSKNFLRQFRDKNSRQLKKFSATQFMEVWNHYDSDGNGYIEGTELDNFLREFIASVNNVDTGPEVISDTAMAHLRDVFMDAFDENEDNRIEICELAQILPTEENFLLLFRRENPLESSVEFMRVWREFDKDCSGYIEADELKDFLNHLLKQAKKDNEVTDEKLIEYTDTMLQLFDANKDGKLQLSEMAKLLPVRENFLCRPIFKGANRITRRDIDRVFALYDRDKNGTIENEELNGFLKDLTELVQQDYDTEDIAFLKSAILDQWDVNNDGKINKSELTMLLLHQGRLCAEAEGLDYDEEGIDGNDEDDE